MSNQGTNDGNGQSNGVDYMLQHQTQPMSSSPLASMINKMPGLMENSYFESPNGSPSLELANPSFDSELRRGSVNMLQQQQHQQSLGKNNMMPLVSPDSGMIPTGFGHQRAGSIPSLSQGGGFHSLSPTMHSASGTITPPLMIPNNGGLSSSNSMIGGNGLGNAPIPSRRMAQQQSHRRSFSYTGTFSDTSQSLYTQQKQQNQQSKPGILINPEQLTPQMTPQASPQLSPHMSPQLGIMAMNNTGNSSSNSNNSSSSSTGFRNGNPLEMTINGGVSPTKKSVIAGFHQRRGSGSARRIPHHQRHASDTGSIVSMLCNDQQLNAGTQGGSVLQQATPFSAVNVQPSWDSTNGLQQQQQQARSEGIKRHRRFNSMFVPTSQPFDFGSNSPGHTSATSSRPPDLTPSSSNLPSPSITPTSTTSHMSPHIGATNGMMSGSLQISPHGQGLPPIAPSQNSGLYGMNTYNPLMEPTSNGTPLGFTPSPLQGIPNNETSTQFSPNRSLSANPNGAIGGHRRVLSTSSIASNNSMSDIMISPVGRQLNSTSNNSANTHQRQGSYSIWDHTVAAAEGDNTRRAQVVTSVFHDPTTSRIKSGHQHAASFSGTTGFGMQQANGSVLQNNGMFGLPGQQVLTKADGMMNTNGMVMMGGISQQMGPNGSLTSTSGLLDTESDEEDDTENADDDEDVPQKCVWAGCTEGMFPSRTTLVDHVSTSHIGSGKPEYVCEWEGCSREGKPFLKRHKIRNHVRIHTGERPFVCKHPGCGKKFTRGDGLHTHMKTHAQLKPFVCNQQGCDKAYYHSRSLRKHLNKVHSIIVTAGEMASLDEVIKKGISLQATPSFASLDN